MEKIYPGNLAYYDVGEHGFYYYLYYCKLWVGNTWWHYGFNSDQKALIQHFWNIGSDFIPWHICFAEFNRLLAEGFDHLAPPVAKKKAKWYCRAYDYKYATSYTKQPWHQKKEKSAREEWRRSSGLYRDKAKNGYRRRFTKGYKQITNAWHRAWTKENIKRENWDVFHRNQKEKHFYDRWYWD